MAEVGGAAFRREDPGTSGPRRIVADVLVVAAVEFSDPVAVLVLVKGNDFACGHVAASCCKKNSARRFPLRTSYSLRIPAGSE